MDFRVYFGPIMLPLKVRMDPLNKCFDSTYNSYNGGDNNKTTASNIQPTNGKVNRRKCTESTALTTKSKSTYFLRQIFFLLLRMCVYIYSQSYETKFVNIIRNYDCNWSLLTRSITRCSNCSKYKCEHNNGHWSKKIMSPLGTFRFSFERSFSL